jgi:HK97 family phage portal protein
MIFPEITRRLKEWLPTSPELVALNLKSTPEGLTFNTLTEVEFYRKYPSLFAQLAGGAPAWSGESVSRNNALNHSVVYACLRLISETLGYLPSTPMIKRGGSKVETPDHPMYSAMRNAPNEEVTAQSFKETLTSDCLLDGDGFARIIRRSGTQIAIGMEWISPSRVRVDREKNTRSKRLVYEVTDSMGRTEGTHTVEPGKPHDIFHLRGLSPDGLRGYNILQLARQSLGTAIAAERSVGQFWKMGGRLPYHLESDRLDGGFANDEEFKQFRKDWESTYSVPHRAPVLPNGIKLEQDGSTMADAQTLETRKWTVSEITRWWGVSPYLVADLEHATFSNIEQQYLDFKTITVARWAKRWEQAYWLCVLTPEEKEKGNFLRVNVDALLRGDFKTRMEGYSSAVQNGYLNRDEVRDLEDRNPLPNGDGQAYTIQMNMQTISGEPSEMEQAITAKRVGNNPAPAQPPQGDTAPTKSYLPAPRDTAAREVKAALREILTELRS